MSTIFSEIIAGVHPCHRIYENDNVLAFLDINPLSPGHTLVIPKEPAETLDQLSDESAASLGSALPRIARAIVAATGIDEYNILQNNGPAAHQAVLHVHFHIIPKIPHGSGLQIGWIPTPIATSSAEELAKRISDELE